MRQPMSVAEHADAAMFQEVADDGLDADFLGKRRDPGRRQHMPRTTAEF
jgi:hypothetical protein